MKKHGFTLTEVLVILGIIGVVAALTIPTLSHEINKKSIITKFPGAIANLENGFSTMLVKENSNTLFGTEAWQTHGSNKTKFAEKLQEYFKILNFYEIDSIEELQKLYGSQKGPFIMNANGTINPTVNDGLAKQMINATTNTLNKGNHCFILKDGTLVFLIINEEKPDYNRNEKIRTQGGALYNEAADIWIDVNGVEKPNTLGRDIFGFYLSDDGKMYPLGGKDAAIYDVASSNSSDYNKLPLWNGDSYWKCSNGNLDDGYGCAARIIDEGYKMNY